MLTDENLRNIRHLLVTNVAFPNQNMVDVIDELLEAREVIEKIRERCDIGPDALVACRVIMGFILESNHANK